MTSKTLLLLAALICTIGSLAAQQPPSTPTIVIRAGTLIDGKSDTPRHNQVIVIQNNRIVSVSDAGEPTAPSGNTIIDLSKATVLLGLIDSHTHIFLQGEDPAEGGYDANILKQPLAYRAARATVAAKTALEQGFTTLRDVETEGAGYGDIGIKQAINEGFIPGPRLFVVTRAISTTGGYQLEDYAPELVMPKGAQIVDGPVEARKAAREQLDHGADWIKVYMTHRSWVGKNGELAAQPTLTVEELKAITDEVHGWGKKVACHAYSGIGLQRALDGGCDSIEHGLQMSDAQIAQMIKQGTWYCISERSFRSFPEPWFPVEVLDPLVEIVATIEWSSLTASKSNTPPERSRSRSLENFIPYCVGIQFRLTQSSTSSCIRVSATHPPYNAVSVV
jgi:imidazolonepropionase-like amidohydrolase